MEEGTLTTTWGDPISTIAQGLMASEGILGNLWMGTGEAFIGVALVAGKV